MVELYDAAFSLVNLPYTILLCVVVVYWIIVIVGLADIDLFGLDMDADVGHADVGHADFGGHGDLGGEMDGAGGIGHAILSFLNLGEVPLMVYLTIVVLSTWVVSMQVNYLLQNDRYWVTLALAAPNFIFGVLVAKFVTTPVKWFNRRPAYETPLVGKVCEVSTIEVNDRFGECVLTENHAPITLTVRTRGGEVLSRGDLAVIVEKVRKDNSFVVTKHRGEN
jgi:hypothetical protein